MATNTELVQNGLLFVYKTRFIIRVLHNKKEVSIMVDEKKIYDGIELGADEEMTADTIEELSNNKGDDE